MLHVRVRVGGRVDGWRVVVDHFFPLAIRRSVAISVQILHALSCHPPSHIHPSTAMPHHNGWIAVAAAATTVSSRAMHHWLRVRSAPRHVHLSLPLFYPLPHRISYIVSNSPSPSLPRLLSIHPAASVHPCCAGACAPHASRALRHALGSKRMP